MDQVVVEGSRVPAGDQLEFFIGLDPVMAGAVRENARLRGISPQQVIELAVARVLKTTADHPLDLIDVEC